MKSSKSRHQYYGIGAGVAVFFAVSSIILVLLQTVYIQSLQDQVDAMDTELLKIQGNEALASHSRAKRQVSAAGGCVQGDRGRDGRDGRDGLRGFMGPAGPLGPSGPQGVAGPPGESLSADQLEEVLATVIQNSKKRVSSSSNVNINGGDYNNTSSAVGGSVYVRWGRTQCRQGVNLLYEGVAGGKYHSHSGGGSQILCLPRVPQWGKYMNGFQSNSFIYGTEYELGPNNPFTGSKASLHDHDVPCAVCHVTDRGSHVMIPAWKTCPAGWRHEYNGYLMAGYYKHATNSFVCVDESPQVELGSAPNANGALLYVVEAQCGSLPCPGFRSGRELTCVVCSR